MRYRNRNTGAVIEVSGILQGGGWEAAADTASEKEESVGQAVTTGKKSVNKAAKKAVKKDGQLRDSL